MQISALPGDASGLVAPDGIRLVRADNPSMMTLTGTNTWVVQGDGSGVVVIDPGPPLVDHLAAIRDAGSPAAIVLTHHHLDHSEAAPALAAEFRIPVFAARPELAIDSTPLVEGDVIDIAGVRLSVMSVPGHTDDSIVIASAAHPGILFTGDTLLGGSTTVIAPPTGSLADYFETMERLSAFTDRLGLSGHGTLIGSVGAWAAHNAAYRNERLSQLVTTWLDGGFASAPDRASAARGMADAVYGAEGTEVTENVVAMMDAQIEFLGGRGDIRVPA